MLTQFEQFQKESQDPMLFWSSTVLRKETAMALLSLFCSFLVFWTCWLILPMLVFGPLSVYFGWKSYRQTTERVPNMRPGRRLLAFMPILIAIASMPASMIFLSATYRA
ncbi:hypothetical protein MASSI9I_90513 [Massilia sp. 9I]|nr:hypothetical protein MASSI9I_90513 [Massilia sp. 9I]